MREESACQFNFRNYESMYVIRKILPLDLYCLEQFKKSLFGVAGHFAQHCKEYAEHAFFGESLHTTFDELRNVARMRGLVKL